MKVLFSFGTRPEAIKLAPVIHEFQRVGIDHKICVTAQHREMLDQVLNFFSIVPDWDLNLMTPGQNLNELSSSIFKRISPILERERPDVIIVQGDTTTAFCTAMAAFNAGIKVAHIEAGLRTRNIDSPFPEEANRQLIARIASFHFAPTPGTGKNLEMEGLNPDKVFVTGNTSVDALESAQEILESGYSNSEIETLQSKIDPAVKTILVTSHRRENFGEGLIEICQALNHLSNRKDVQLIFPVHPNPEVEKLVYEYIEPRSNMHLVRPLNFPAVLWLIKRCHFIISDSGGIQEEAPSFGKMVLVTRNSTERTEGIEAGFSILVGTSSQNIIKESQRLLEEQDCNRRTINPYGDGKASKKISHILLNSFRN